jgi:hypothetical protein
MTRLCFTPLLALIVSTIATAGVVIAPPTNSYPPEEFAIRVIGEAEVGIGQVIIPNGGPFGIFDLVLYENTSNPAAGLDDVIPIDCVAPDCDRSQIEIRDFNGVVLEQHFDVLLANYPPLSLPTSDGILIDTPVHQMTVGQTLGIIDHVQPWNFDVTLYHTLRRPDNGNAYETGLEVTFPSNSPYGTSLQSDIITFDEPGTYFLDSFVPYGGVAGTYWPNSVQVISVTVPEPLGVLPVLVVLGVIALQVRDNNDMHRSRKCRAGSDCVG